MSMLPSFSSAFGGAAHASAPHSSHSASRSGSRSGSGSSHKSVGASSATPSLSTSFAPLPPTRAAAAPLAAPASAPAPAPAAPLASASERRAAPMAPHASATATAPKRPGVDPLPFEKYGLLVDGSSYLGRTIALNGRGGAPSQGSLTAGLFNSNQHSMIASLGVLEDSTHPDPPAASAAGPGATSIDLNGSFQSSAIARHGTASSFLRGPTASDISALWSTPVIRSNAFDSIPIDDHHPQPAPRHEQPVHPASAAPALSLPQPQLVASAPLSTAPASLVVAQHPLTSAAMGAINAPSPFVSAALPLVSAPSTLAGSSVLAAAPSQSMPLSSQLCVIPSSNPLAGTSLRLATSSPLAPTSIPALVRSASPMMSSAPPPDLTHVSLPLPAAEPPSMQPQTIQPMNITNPALSVPSNALPASLGGLGMVPNKSTMMPFVSAALDYPVSMLTMSGAGAKSSITPFAPATVTQSAALTYPISMGGALSSTSPLVPSAGSGSISHLQNDVQGLNLKQESMLMSSGAGPSRSVGGGGLGMDSAAMPGHQDSSLWPGMASMGAAPRPAREAGPSSAGPSLGVADDGGRRTPSRKRPRSSVDGDADLREQCPHCPLRVRTRVNLQNHLRIVHKSGSEHRCGECSAEFPWKSTLENHVRLVHRKERPFHCERCPKAFRWSSHLEEHVWVVHENKKPFSCSICKKSFGRKNNMQKHMRKVHRADPAR